MTVLFGRSLGDHSAPLCVQSAKDESVRRSVRLRALPLRLIAVVLSLGPVHAQAATYFVSLTGSDSASGLSSTSPYKTVNKALSKAKGGDTISLASGTYLQDVRSVRAGEAGKPIRIVGSSRTATVIKGAGKGRMVEIRHSHIEISNLTLDGKSADVITDYKRQYRNILLYVMGITAPQGLTDVKVTDVSFRNAGSECVHMKYFAHHNEITNSSFEDCGIFDFVYNEGGKNGEAIYIGTAPEQIAQNANPSYDPDASNHNWIHHNTMNTRGNECVDIKEAAAFNIIEHNDCTGQKDPNSGGMDSRGDSNIFRNNKIYDNAGAGVRLGGDAYTDGVDNQIYDNELIDNRYSAIKLEAWPQTKICGNSISGSVLVRGDAANELSTSPTAACP
jgi:hypothetical protein